jgi:hypothetical protein
MTFVSRRQLLSTSGVMLASSSFGAFTVASSAINAQSNASAVATGSINPVLGNYVLDGAAQAVARGHLGNSSSIDYRTLAKQAHLLAHHCEDINLDHTIKQMAKAAQSTGLPTVDVSSLPDVDSAVAMVQKYSPGFTRNNLMASPVAQITSAQAKTALATLATHGISKSLHDIGAQLSLLAPAPVNVSASVAGFAGRLQTATYYPAQQQAMFIPVVDASNCRDKKKKERECDLIAGGTALTAVAIISIICVGVTGGWCAIATANYAYFAYATLAGLALALCGTLSD